MRKMVVVTSISDGSGVITYSKMKYAADFHNLLMVFCMKIPGRQSSETNKQKY